MISPSPLPPHPQRRKHEEHERTKGHEEGLEIVLLESRQVAGRLTFRVRYVECDPMGFLHHSKYLPFFEMGRTDLLRQFGITYRELEERDVLFVVTRVAVSYKRPARYDDEIELVTKILKQTHVRIDHAYEMYNTATRELICTAESTIACINRKGEVQAIPEFLGGKFEGI